MSCSVLDNSPQALSQGPRSPIMIALLCLALSQLLGCSNSPLIVFETESEFIIPKKEWAAETPHPVLKGDTIKDGEDHEFDLDEALTLCNKDKAAIRRYIEAELKRLMEGSENEKD